MAVDLETFAKVRALHDRTDIPGEKAAAAGRMEALARTAGMTVAEALSKLDAAPPQSDLAAAARAWADRYEAAAEAAARAADAPEASSRLRGLPIYDPNKVEPWRDVAEHCLQLDWIIPKAHGGRFLTKAERGRLKGVARHYGSITNATADWIKTVLAQCEVARQSWRDRGKAGVRPDRRATESDIEKAAELVAGAKRREASKMDTPTPKSQAQAAADAFNEFFNTPEMRAERAERERRRLDICEDLLARYGTEDAVFADTPREAALRAACATFLVWDTRPDWKGCYRIGGWDDFGGRRAMPADLREAISTCWPLPETVAAAWAEFEAADELENDRAAFCPDYSPHRWVEARRYALEDLLNTLPARSLNDLRARLSWMEYLNRLEIAPDPTDEAMRLITLRADIERMGARIRDEAAPQNGGAGAVAPSGPTSGDQGLSSPDPGTANGPPIPGNQTDAGSGGVQSGQEGANGTHEMRTPAEGLTLIHPRRTNADKRRDVLALLNMGHAHIPPLSDREIARRAGVSPQTVGNIRRSLS